MKRAQCRRKFFPTASKYKKFGELVTMDYMEARRTSQSSEQHQCLLTVYDLGTRYLSVYPTHDKSAWSTQQALKLFRGRNNTICMYADRAKELDCAATAMGIPCDRARAGRPQTNGIIERRNQEVNRGTKALLVGAGLPPPLWYLAAPCYCHMENVIDEGGTSPYYRRHKEHFQGKLIPFGSRVKFKLLTTSGLDDDVDKFRPSTHVGLFLGYDLKFGGAWSGNYLVAPMECFDKMSLIVSAPHVQCKAKLQVVAEVEPDFRDCSLPRGPPWAP